jgi:hypothetical protein
MRLDILVFSLAGLAFAVGGARAQSAPLENTSAFEKAYATSYYTFDACGDSKRGRFFRQVLVDRFRQCAFTPAARDAFKIHAAKLREKSVDKIFQLIEANGGLLTKVEGMSMTCREQQHLPDYLALAAKLDQYAAGQLTAVDVAPSPCDAENITP